MKARRTRPRPANLVAIDLGLAADPTGIVTINARPGATKTSPPHLTTISAERLPLGTEYQAVAGHLAAVVAAIDNQTGKPPTVVVDGSGVGGGVIEIIDSVLAANVDLVSVIFTSGQDAGGDDRRMTVPKAQLLTGVQLALERRRLTIPPEANNLRNELAAFQGRTTAAGRLTGEARSGATDDLVAALAIGIHVADHRWQQRHVKVTSQAGKSLPTRTGIRNWHQTRSRRY